MCVDCVDCVDCTRRKILDLFPAMMDLPLHACTDCMETLQKRVIVRTTTIPSNKQSTTRYSLNFMVACAPRVISNYFVANLIIAGSQ